MIYLPFASLEPGMVLAREIPGVNFRFPFAAVGYELTPQALDKMNDHGIQGAYIQNKMTDGIEPQTFIAPEVKNQMLSVLKKNFNKSVNKTAFCSSAGSYKELSDLAESVVLNVLDQEKMMFQMIEVRDYDNYTYSHSLYVGILSVLLGTQMGLSRFQLSELALCGLMHDVGKTEVPIEITNKRGPLTDEEMMIMRDHPNLSAQKLENSHSFSIPVVQGVRNHHEKFDGTGYPDQLARFDIPLYARILSVADVYDALCSSRPYRKAWPAEQTFNYLLSCADSHFDPDILFSFLQCVSAYPVGTLVNLSDGSTGVVKDNTPGFALRPIVRFLTPPEKAGTEVDLSCECLNITIVEPS